MNDVLQYYVWPRQGRVLTYLAATAETVYLKLLFAQTQLGVLVFRRSRSNKARYIGRGKTRVYNLFYTTTVQQTRDRLSGRGEDGLVAIRARARWKRWGKWISVHDCVNRQFNKKEKKNRKREKQEDVHQCQLVRTDGAAVMWQYTYVVLVIILYITQVHVSTYGVVIADFGFFRYASPFYRIDK